MVPWLRCLAFLGALAWALPAPAQQLTVQSGEHARFTRLVVPFPPGRSWKVNQNGRDATVSIDGYDGVFDTSGIFDLIPRDRLAEVSAGQGRLTLRLACDCEVRTFVEQNRFLVLDISDAPNPTQTAEDEPPPSQTASTPANGPSLGWQPGTRSAVSRSADTLKPLDLPRIVGKQRSPAEQEMLRQMQESLARELSLATTRGLLNPKIRSRPEAPKVIAEPPAEPQEPTAEPPQRAQLRISSSMDVPGADRMDAPLQNAVICPAEGTLDVGSWSNGQPFAQQMGALRQKLFAEFDRLDPEVAVTLARAYVYFGFGAEARQILRLDPGLAAAEPLLLDVATIVETGSAAPGSSLVAFMECRSEVSLWAILARKSLEADRLISPNPALRALEELPLHLRKIIAPMLSNRLLDAGYPEAAAAALRNLERLPTAMPAEGQYAQAKIAIEDGAAKTGESLLGEVIEKNGEKSPQALLALVETRRATRQVVEPETIDLIEAYAKEHAGQPLGAQLDRALVQAFALSGQFDRAFEAYDELPGDMAEKDREDLKAELIADLAETADDILFLDHVFGQTPDTLARLPINSRLALSARLLDLGFAAQAQLLVSTVPDLPRRDERQLLAARAAIDLRQPQRALAALFEVQGAEAQLLRAAAAELAGAHGDAAGMYQQTEAVDAATRTAWLADNPVRDVLREDPIFGPVLDLRERDLAAATLFERDGMLGRGNAALAESAAAREALAALLSAPELSLGNETATE